MSTFSRESKRLAGESRRHEYQKQKLETIKASVRQMIVSQRDEISIFSPSTAAAHNLGSGTIYCDKPTLMTMFTVRASRFREDRVKKTERSFLGSRPHGDMSVRGRREGMKHNELQHFDII